MTSSFCVRKITSQEVIGSGLFSNGIVGSFFSECKAIDRVANPSFCHVISEQTMNPV